MESVAEAGVRTESEAASEKGFVGEEDPLNSSSALSKASSGLSDEKRQLRPSVSSGPPKVGANGGPRKEKWSEASANDVSDDRSDSRRSQRVDDLEEGQPIEPYGIIPLPLPLNRAKEKLSTCLHFEEVEFLKERIIRDDLSVQDPLEYPHTDGHARRWLLYRDCDGYLHSTVVMPPVQTFTLRDADCSITSVRKLDNRLSEFHSRLRRLVEENIALRLGGIVVEDFSKEAVHTSTREFVNPLIFRKAKVSTIEAEQFWEPHYTRKNAHTFVMPPRPLIQCKKKKGRSSLSILGSVLSKGGSILSSSLSTRRVSVGQQIPDFEGSPSIAGLVTEMVLMDHSSEEQAFVEGGRRSSLSDLNRQIRKKSGGSRVGENRRISFKEDDSPVGVTLPSLPSPEKRNSVTPSPVFVTSAVDTNFQTGEGQRKDVEVLLPRQKTYDSETSVGIHSAAPPNFLPDISHTDWGNFSFAKEELHGMEEDSSLSFLSSDTDKESGKSEPKENEEATKEDDKKDPTPEKKPVEATSASPSKNVQKTRTGLGISWMHRMAKSFTSYPSTSEESMKIQGGVRTSRQDDPKKKYAFQIASTRSERLEPEVGTSIYRPPPTVKFGIKLYKTLYAAPYPSIEGIFGSEFVYLTPAESMARRGSDNGSQKPGQTGVKERRISILPLSMYENYFLNKPLYDTRGLIQDPENSNLIFFMLKYQGGIESTMRYLFNILKWRRGFKPETLTPDGSIDWLISRGIIYRSNQCNGNCIFIRPFAQKVVNWKRFEENLSLALIFMLEAFMRGGLNGICCENWERQCCVKKRREKISVIVDFTQGGENYTSIRSGAVVKMLALICYGYYPFIMKRVFIITQRLQTFVALCKSILMPHNFAQFKFVSQASRISIFRSPKNKNKTKHDIRSPKLLQISNHFGGSLQFEPNIYLELEKRQYHLYCSFLRSHF